MDITKFSEDDLKEIEERRKALEAIEQGDLGKVTKLKTITDTNKKLMDLFNAPEKYAVKDNESDFKKVKDILEERKGRLEKRDTISSDDDINNFYTALKNPAGADITPDKKDKIAKDTENLYTNDLLANTYVNKLPIFKDFGKNIRSNPTYKIKDIEAKKIKKVSELQITDITKELKANDHFKGLSLSNEMQIKLTKLIILFSQLDKFNQTKINKDNELDAAKKIITKIKATLNELKVHRTTTETINLIDKRIKNIGGIETTDPKKLPDKAPGKIAIEHITYPLKEHFLNPAKGLTEAPEGYELTGLKFKDSKGTPIEIFEDIGGTIPFERSLKKGEKADIFFKSGTTFQKLANIEITDVTNPELIMHMEAYKDLPSIVLPAPKAPEQPVLIFPANFECTMTGIGGNTKDVNNKVGITKQINGKLDKPDFTGEYISLDGKYKIKNKLNDIFQEQYIAQLKDRFYEFMDTDERTNNGIKKDGEWSKMDSNQRNHFFQDTIMKNSNPSWLGAGIYAMITGATQANCYGNIDFTDDFQKRILDIFEGKNEQDLKKLIFEKLGNLDFTALNPTYAIKILADKVKDKFIAHKDGLYEALNAYLLEYGEGRKKPMEEKLKHGELAAVKEIKAVVADSKEISRETAYKNSLKKIEDQYKSGVKFGYTRAKIFFFREKMLKNLIAKELKGTGGLKMDDATNSAVNRWAAEKSMGGSFAENIIDVEKDTTEKVFDDPIFQQELDVSVWKYINGTTVDDATFEAEIEALIDGNAELRNYMKRNKITHLGTNIIEQAKAEKAERSYYGETIEIIDKYSRLGMSNKPQEFEKEIRSALEKFMKEQKKLPDMVKSLGLNIDKIDFATKLATHRITLETMRTRTVKMRLSLLVNKAEEEKGLTTAQYVNQDKFDVKHMTKFTKRMGKHPRWTTGITTLGLVGTGVVGALTTPVFGAIGGASILWYLNFLKKKGHYTQEHKKFEETIIAMTPEQRKAYLEDLKENSEKRPARIRRAFPTRYTKYGKSMEYFENVDSVDASTKKIQKYMEKSGPLTTIEKNAFQRHLVDAISLLQAHKEKGRNFMYGKEGNIKIEELYNELYKMILAGVTRYNPLAKNPEIVVAKILSPSGLKTSTNVDNNMDEYDRDYKKMRRMRGRLGVMAGTRSAAIYLGSAYAFGWIKNQVIDGWNHMFGTTTTPAATPATTAGATPATTAGATPTAAPTSVLTTTTVLDPAFGPNGKDLLNSKIFDGNVGDFNTFVARVQTIPGGSHSEKLRLIFKDMYGTDQLANQKTHEFFNLFSSQITDMPASAQQELIRLGANNFNLHSASQISDLMTSRGYHGMVTNQTDITNLLAGFKSGAIDLNTLPAGRTKETACNVLFCNTQGEQLTDLIFDKVSLLPPVGPGPGPIPPLPPGPGPIPPVGPGPGPIPPGPRGPRYDNFLSFGAPTVRNEVNKFNNNEPAPAATNNDTDE